MSRVNKTLTKEWIDKAEGDYEVAVGLYKTKRKKKIYYIIAFHCQQAIEKYLKALLICYAIEFPKIHDLIQLLNLVKKKDPFLNGIRTGLEILNPFSVWFRYPGEKISLEELKEVVNVTKGLRKILQKRAKEFI